MGEFGSVTIRETEFPAGLAWVKAKTLSGSGRVSRVRFGPGRVTGLSCFPYPGVIRLAGLSGLSSDKGKTSPRAGFSLIPQPRLG
jgi:hypothetical protein